MDETILEYARATLIGLGLGGVIYVVVTGQPNAAESVGIILAATGALVGMLQTQVTHALVKDLHTTIADVPPPRLPPT